MVNREFDNRDKLKITVNNLTYVRVGSKRNYVCILIVLANRELIGYAAGANKDANLIKKGFCTTGDRRHLDIPFKHIPRVPLRRP